jgi:hypothetical protein
MYSGIKSGCSWLSHKTKAALLTALDFIKTHLLFMNTKETMDKVKALKIVINISVVVLVISFYPILKRGIHKA